MTTNQYRTLHQTRDGQEMLIVSMRAKHLINMVNLVLVKGPEIALQERRYALLGQYASADVTRSQAKALGLQMPNEEEITQAKGQLERIEEAIMDDALALATPYIVVGLTRDDTREEVLEIVQSVTEITGQLIPHDIPGDQVYFLPDGSATFDEDDQTPQDVDKYDDIPF